MAASFDRPRRRAYNHVGHPLDLIRPAPAVYGERTGSVSGRIGCDPRLPAQSAATMTGAGPARRRESDCHDSPPRRLPPRDAVAAPVGDPLRTDGPTAIARQPAVATEEAAGQFFTIAEPITSETFEKPKSAPPVEYVDATPRRGRASSPSWSSSSSPARSRRLPVCAACAATWRNLHRRAGRGEAGRVAYVPTPLRGYAVLPVIACTEIVMGATASLGPITPEGLPFDAAYRELVRFLALRKTRDPDLLLGMLDRDADLRLVRTADRAVHYVLAENLDAFQKVAPGHRGAAGVGRRHCAAS